MLFDVFTRPLILCRSLCCYDPDGNVIDRIVMFDTETKMVFKWQTRNHDLSVKPTVITTPVSTFEFVVHDEESKKQVLAALPLEIQGLVRTAK